MITITEPLLVGVDGSPASDAALHFACREAAARRVPVAILHAWQPFPAYASGPMMGPGPGTPSPVDQERIGQQVLDAAAAIVAGYGGAVSHHSYLVQDAPAAALVNASADALLLVVGGRDRAQHEPGWLGPVPLRLCAKAHCPVIVVPTMANEQGTVVVGVDGSASSDDVLGFAFHQASRHGAGLTAVLSFDLRTQVVGLDATGFTTAREDAGRQLDDALAGWVDKFPDVAVMQVVSDEPAVRALQAAAATAALVVVGSRGHGFFLRHVMGSVSSALLRTSNCPVAVVGPELRDVDRPE